VGSIYVKGKGRCKRGYVLLGMKKMGKNMVAQVPKLRNNTCPEPQNDKIDIV
jgi:hypothetical protein